MMLEKIMKSGQAPEKGRIRASAGKVGIRVSTGKVGSRQVSKKVESRRVSKRSNPGKYREGKIHASTGKVESGRVPEK